MSDSSQNASGGGVPFEPRRRMAAIASNQNTILVGVLIILIGIFSALEPKFFSVATASNILTDWGSVVLIAVGMTFVIVSGGIDLSVGAVIGLRARRTGRAG